MNRRGFLHKIAGAVAGAVAVCVLPKEEKPEDLPLKLNKAQKEIWVDAIPNKAQDELTVAKLRKCMDEMKQIPQPEWIYFPVNPDNSSDYCWYQMPGMPHRMHGYYTTQNYGSAGTTTA